MADRFRLCWQNKDGSGRVEHTVYFYTVESEAKDDARRLMDLYPQVKYWVEQEPQRGEWEALKRR